MKDVKPSSKKQRIKQFVEDATESGEYSADYSSHSFASGRSGFSRGTPSPTTLDVTSSPKQGLITTYLLELIASRRKIAMAAIPIGFISYVLTYLFTKNLLVSLLWALIGYGIPYVLLGQFRRWRINKLSLQLLDIVNSLSTSVKAGLSLNQAFATVANTLSIRNPGMLSISAEFARMVRQLNLGAPIEDVLKNLNHRIESPELELISSVLLLHQELGGDLGRMLDTTAVALRERTKIKQEVRRATAQARMSGIVGLILPFALALVIYRLRPEYITPLFSTSLGRTMLSFAVALVALGIFMINRIVKNIEY